MRRCVAQHTEGAVGKLLALSDINYLKIKIFSQLSTYFDL